MKEKFFLFVYLIFVAIVASTTNVTLLALTFLLTIVLFLFTRTKFPVKLLLPTIAINLILSLSYLVLRKHDCINFIALFNLRTFTLLLMTLFFSKNVNLFNALNFSPSLSALLVIAYSQILVFKNTFTNFKEAFRSRLIEKPKKKDAYRFASSVSYYFFNRALKNSEEIAQAMKSRGFFNG
jgi:cobalt/nickel transport system permease protein